MAETTHAETTSSANEAKEIIGGKVETVEVSKHPDSTIPETELSLADIERSKAHPTRSACLPRWSHHMGWGARSR